MPRGPLSVILRGSKLLAAKQVVKSTIVTLCGESHLSWIQDPDVIRVHPLFRALCLGANTSVVDPANCHWYFGDNSHTSLPIACMHRPPQPPAPLALHKHPLSAQVAHAPTRFGERKSRRFGIGSKHTYAKPAATLLPKGGESSIRNTHFLNGLAATGQRSKNDARKLQLVISQEPLNEN